MNKKSSGREHLRLIGSILLSCVIGALLAAVTAAIILRYVAVESPSKRYDDVEKILSQYDPGDFRGVTIDPDGGLRVRLEKNDIYWYASEYGIFERFERRLAALEETSGWEIRRRGFQVEGDQVVLQLYAARRLPAYFRVTCDVECQGTVMTLRPVEVAISGYLELPEERWPSLLPREGFRLDFAELGVSRCLRRVSTEGNALVLEGDGISQALSGQLMLDMSRLRALEAYGCERVDTWGMYSWAIDLGTDKVPMAEAHQRMLASGDAAGAMADLLSCCTGLSRMEMFSGWDRFTLEFAAVAVSDAAEQRQEQLKRYIAAEQWKYEKLLTSIREMYKSGTLCLGEKGLYVTQTKELFDASSLTMSLNITALDSRPVLLYTDRGGAQGIRTTDMPRLGEVGRLNERCVKELDLDRVYDVGMLLTTESGIMALVHYRNDNTFVLRQVSETVYTRLLMAKGIPALNVDELYTPEERSSTPGVDPTSPYEILLKAK